MDRNTAVSFIETLIIAVKANEKELDLFRKRDFNFSLSNQKRYSKRIETIKENIIDHMCNKKITPKPPRYDKVFEDGVKWLDENG